MFFVYQNDKWNKVSFSELDTNIQEALEMFAQTQEGYDFLAAFAKEGDKIGDVEFNKNGIFSEHNYNLFQISGSNILGGAMLRNISKNELNFDVQFNKDRDKSSGQTIEDYVITLSHENFIHLDRYVETAVELHKQGKIDELKELRNKVFNNAARDHKGYAEKDEAYVRMNKLINQLSNKQNAAAAWYRHNRKYKFE